MTPAVTVICMPATSSRSPFSITGPSDDDFFNFIINLVRTLVLIEMSVLGEKTISATQHRLDLSQLKQVFPVKEYFNIVYIYFSSPSYGLYSSVSNLRPT